MDPLLGGWGPGAGPGPGATVVGPSSAAAASATRHSIDTNIKIRFWENIMLKFVWLTKFKARMASGYDNYRQSNINEIVTI